MSLIKWKESDILKNVLYGYTAEDIENEEISKYEIRYNTHLIIHSSNIGKIYLASIEDAKQCAELIERGRAAE
jgi:hypothetical protein